MKTIDFTKPGGFPLTQDQLGYLQTAYSECFGALGNAACNGVPIKLSGMNTSMPVGGYTSISAGWIFYNGEIIRFAPSGVSAVLLGSEIYIVIATTSAPLSFNDGSTPNVINEKVATAQVLSSSTPVDTTHFKYSSLMSFGQALGIAYRESAWQHITVATAAGSGTIGGDIYYKKDTVANTLQIRGELITTSPSDFAAWPNVSSILMGTVSAAYRPANNAYFTIRAVTAGAMLKDINGTWFNRLNATLQTDGKLYVDWLQTDPGVPIYGMIFNLVLPLD